MDQNVFRKEAIEHYAGSRVEHGRMLIVPAMARQFYFLLLVLIGTTGLFLLIGSVGEYAVGTVVIRSRERIAVTAMASSIVADLPVRVGTQVARGDVLVSLHAADEEAQMSAVQREFDANLVRMLANPGDYTARQALASFRAQRELLLARRNERLLRAPDAGIVRDIRVRPGQSVSPGEVVLSIVTGLSGFVANVVLPGQQRPLLRAGLPMRIELKGIPYNYQTATIDTVGEEIVGPQEARKLLGSDVADSLSLAGPQVFARASLGDHFDLDGSPHRYVDGMQGTARVQLRRKRLITLFIPGLEDRSSMP